MKYKLEELEENQIIVWSDVHRMYVVQNQCLYCKSTLHYEENSEPFHEHNYNSLNKRFLFYSYPKSERGSKSAVKENTIMVLVDIYNVLNFI